MHKEQSKHSYDQYKMGEFATNLTSSSTSQILLANITLAITKSARGEATMIALAQKNYQRDGCCKY